MWRARTASPHPGGNSSRFKPGGHWTRSLLPSPDGQKLYAGVGSLSNIAENGMAVEEGRAAIYELDLADGSSRIFASGLRNAVGMAWEPQTGVLWTVVNERDGLGDETPPDYLTSVRDGGFYGWPYCYWGQTVDDRVPQDPAAVAKAITPDYALGGHTASLGLCWLPAGTLPGFPDGMAIGQHGSWNRSTLSGYKVVFVPFANGRPAGPPRDILSGFLAPDERESYGRPVGVTLGPDGSLLVADDVGDVIWRVTGDSNAEPELSAVAGFSSAFPVFRQRPSHRPAANRPSATVGSRGQPARNLHFRPESESVAVRLTII